MAILDGEFIDDKDIDPAKHKFIGTFREPFSAYEDMAGEFHCRCGEHLFNQQSILDHWQKGHMDAPQYVTVRNLNENNFQQRHLCKGNLPKLTHPGCGFFSTECWEDNNKYFLQIEDSMVGTLPHVWQEGTEAGGRMKENIDRGGIIIFSFIVHAFCFTPDAPCKLKAVFGLLFAGCIFLLFELVEMRRKNKNEPPT